jgi:LCP family protein required for cell wall assembly
MSLFIMALLPLTAAVWALSIVVPVILETRAAIGDVFVTPVPDRVHFDDANPSPPQLPGMEAHPSSTATAEQAASPTNTSTARRTPTATGSPTPSVSPTARATGTPTITPSPSPTVTGPTPTPYPPWDGSEPVHILLLGVDSRPDETDPPRSDTIIVVRVDPVLERVDAFSIPRDLLVEIPGYGATKINAAYVYGELDGLPGGGPILAAQTIEYNFGIRIDYFATVNISGMERIVDTIGGIIVDVPAVVKDDQYPTEDYRYTRVYFPTGLQPMDGREAVQYSRTRHGDNDFRRSERQQQVLLAIRDQILVSGVITNLPAIINEIGDSVRTDLSVRQVLSLARFGQDLPREQIYLHSLNHLMEEAMIDDGFYFIGDWYSLRNLVQNLPDNPNASNNPGG